MSSKYFKNFPLVEYKGTQLRNILLKATILRDLFLDDTTFYDYFIENGEKPTHVAFNYYGSVDYTWLVFLSNKISDPYFQWYLSNEEFEQYITKKYGSVQEAYTEIVEYKTLFDGVETSEIISVRTKLYYDSVGLSESFTFQPVYAYDKEFEANEARRRIKLIDRKYSSRISNELEKALSL
jgi:hypothetical protein